MEHYLVIKRWYVVMGILINGIETAIQLSNILPLVIGVILGIFFGATPGLTTSMGITFMLPVTFTMSPQSAISLLIGLYVGGVSGGLITAILLNIPGTPAAIPTTFDGHALAKKGQAEKALSIAILYSFLGGIFSLIVLFFIAPPIAKIAIQFGPIEYFSIAIFSLTLISSLSGKSILRGLQSACIGGILATVGVTPIDGYPRFTLGIHELDGGFKLITLIIGVYAVTQLLEQAKSTKAADISLNTTYHSHGFKISKKEFISQLPNYFRSSIIGTFVGILPGVGAGIASMLSYSTAKNSSKNKDKFGTGCIDGIIASESANNAVSGGAFVPLLALGIPGDAGTAIMLAALMMQGVTVGPLLFRQNIDFVYTIFALLLLANILMIIIEYFSLPIFIKMLKVPMYLLYPVIITFCVIGAFGINNRIFDVRMIVVFGVLGYLMQYFKYPIAPLILGFILTPMIETNLRRGLMLAYGSFLNFFTRPVATIFVIGTIIIIIYQGIREYSNYKKIRRR